MMRSCKAERKYRDFSNRKPIKYGHFVELPLRFELYQERFSDIATYSLVRLSVNGYHTSIPVQTIFFLLSHLSLIIVTTFIEMIFRDSTPAQA